MGRSYSNYENNFKKYSGHSNQFKAPKSMIKEKNRNEQWQENLIDWVTFYRRNIHRFVQHYFGVKLYWYQILWIYFQFPQIFSGLNFQCYQLIFFLHGPDALQNLSSHRQTGRRLFLKRIELSKSIVVSAHFALQIQILPFYSLLSVSHLVGSSSVFSGETTV